MNRDGNFWTLIVWTMFVLLIGIGLGMWWRIQQVEPQLTTAQAEIKEYQRSMARDFTDLDVRLTLVEKQIHGTRVKK